MIDRSPTRSCKMTEGRIPNMSGLPGHRFKVCTVHTVFNQVHPCQLSTAFWFLLVAVCSSRFFCSMPPDMQRFRAVHVTFTARLMQRMLHVARCSPATGFARFTFTSLSDRLISVNSRSPCRLRAAERSALQSPLKCACRVAVCSPPSPLRTSRLLVHSPNKTVSHLCSANLQELLYVAESASFIHAGYERKATKPVDCAPQSIMCYHIARSQRILLTRDVRSAWRRLKGVFTTFKSAKSMAARQLIAIGSATPHSHHARKKGIAPPRFCRDARWPLAAGASHQPSQNGQRSIGRHSLKTWSST